MDSLGSQRPVSLLKSFFGGGFECSTFRRRSGQRMDFVAASRHDRFARLDYARLRGLGMLFAREGLRWHLVESRPGAYDFRSALPSVRAARCAGVQVIWDLCHFGWPDDVDLFSVDFGTRLARYGAAFARWLSNETNGPLMFVPVNEISYFSWAAGDEGSMFPFVVGRGFELKRLLVRAVIQTIDSIRSMVSDARFLHVDPVIHVVADPRRPQDQSAAAAYSASHYQSWDMLAGCVSPELGGKARYLDLLGLNFYSHNQWFYNLRGARRVRKFRKVPLRHPLYRPFRDMLREVHQRYHRPFFIAETGAEGRARRGWLRYVCQETAAALSGGLPVQGICLYPILNHPGWEDDRHCYNGLWDYPDERGNRAIYAPLAAELELWRRQFENGGRSCFASPEHRLESIENEEQ